jgi:hypothetical protein
MKKIVKIGPIEFNHYSIKNPSEALLKDWAKDILPLAKSMRAELWLSSRFLDPLSNTKDIDIVVLGDIPMKSIHTLLLKGYELAFYKFKFNLDMQWYSHLPKYSSLVDKNINIKQEEVTKYRLMNKVLINNQIKWDKTEDSIEIYPGLFKVIEKMPSKKQINYIKNGLIYPESVELNYKYE